MKNTRSLLAGLIFLGSITAGGTALAADGVISKDELSTDSYCHQKFTAMTESSVASDDPVLESGDVIDYYGRCNENPTGKDQVQQQKLENQTRWRYEYEH